MKKNGWIGALSVVVVLAWTGMAAAKRPTCDAVGVAAAKAAVDTACPCAGKSDGQGGTLAWKNHGQYVSCVSKASKAEAKNAGVSRQCIKDVVPCAANSTCGKSSDVACIITSGTCLGDPAPGDLTQAGTCDNDSTKLCDTDADCSVQSCAVMSAGDCTLSGGTAASGSCCSE